AELHVDVRGPARVEVRLRIGRSDLLEAVARSARGLRERARAERAAPAQRGAHLLPADPEPGRELALVACPRRPQAFAGERAAAADGSRPGAARRAANHRAGHAERAFIGSADPPPGRLDKRPRETTDAAGIAQADRCRAAVARQRLGTGAAGA